MKNLVKQTLGPTVQVARTARMLTRVMRAGFGLHKRECPICGFSGHFHAEIHFPDVFRFDALCPRCVSLPRTRMLWHVITREALIGKDGIVLHFAPEKCIAGRLRNMARGYRTADLYEPGVDLKLNIEQIDLEDASQDVVICSHVLEHVDDGKAIGELYRIVKPGGVALIMVPIWLGWATTYEAEPMLDRAARRLHYGRGDHLRRYGSDLLQRLKAPGFAVEIASASGGDTVRYGLTPGEVVLKCIRPL